MDHLWVVRAPNSKDWNATKLFNYGTGCLITADGAFTVHGWYTYTGGTPTPEPPPVAGCSSPLPPKVWTAETLPDGWGGDQIKVGSITQSERLAKYNRLLAIEAETGLPLVEWPASGSL